MNGTRGTRYRAFLMWFLCRHYDVHHVNHEDREYADHLEGGYQGPCSRCPEWVTEDRSGL